MIDLVSLSKEWLAEKQKKYNRDPGIIESMIHALYLLEQLKLTGLDFIFKGGTSLVLIMDQPARFSVDIDIIVDPDLKKEELEKFLNKILGLSAVFIRMELDERRSYKAGVPKAHYRFIYKSTTTAPNKEGQVMPNPEREILLDVLFAKNPYPVLLEKPINTEWVKLKSDPLIVKTPCVNSITGDKLTAFAPNTTGVPYYRQSVNKAGEVFNNEMFKEIIKQLFDIGCLFNVIDNVNTFRKSYEETAVGEMKYRAERNIKSKEEILKDTISTALIIARRDKHVDEGDQKKFTDLSRGINQFGHFVYLGNFRIEQAQLAGAKAAYLAAIVMTEYSDSLMKFDETIPLKDYLITHPEYIFLNKQLKSVLKGEALFYWNETIKLLHP
jgi:hypothetical protein